MQKLLESARAYLAGLEADTSLPKNESPTSEMKRRSRFRAAVWDQHDAELDFIADLERMLTIRCEL
jgi:hypothetical protein